MKRVNAFGCEGCEQTFKDAELAKEHEVACLREAATKTTQAEIARKWAELKKVCRHPHADRNLIPNMSGSNYHLECPDCGFTDDEFDISR